MIQHPVCCAGAKGHPHPKVSTFWPRLSSSGRGGEAPCDGLRRGPPGSPASRTPSCRHGLWQGLLQLSLSPPWWLQLRDGFCPLGPQHVGHKRGTKAWGEAACPQEGNPRAIWIDALRLSHYYSADALLSKGAHPSLPSSQPICSSPGPRAGSKPDRRVGDFMVWDHPSASLRSS